MSMVDDFMKAHDDECDATMGTSVMTCNGQTFNAVANLASRAVDGDFGGLEPQVRGIVTAQAADVTAPLAMLNKRCTVAGVSYRISLVDAGSVAVHFTLADPNEK